MSVFLEFNNLSHEQKQYLLDNYQMSNPVKAVLSSLVKKDPCYLFFKRRYSEIWWNDEVKGEIVSFDEFVTKINEYKLMDML